MARPVFLLVGLAFVVVTAWRAWSGSDGTQLPGVPATVAALALLLSSLLLGSTAWLVLFPEVKDRHDFRFGFFVAQLGKYVPGAVWQAAGQIGFARGPDVSLSLRSSRFFTAALVMVASGGAVGSLAALTCTDCPGWFRLAALGGLGPLVLLHGRVLGFVVERLDRAGRATAHLVPPARERRRCLLWSVSSVLANAGAFAVLTDAMGGGAPLVRTATAFALAWTVGYVALPFPSGIGIREAVLILAAPVGLGPGAVVAASLAHRLVSLAAEVVLVGATSVGGRRARRGAHPE